MEEKHQQIRAKINETEFTLFYDYDELRDGKIHKLSDGKKIEWLHHRMEFVFLNPLKKIFDKSSVVYKQLNSPGGSGDSFFMTAAFSVLLNGVEALGSFLIPNEGNQPRFNMFVKNYMNEWSEDKERLDIIWRFRNSIAHAFVMKKGGIEYCKAHDDCKENVITVECTPKEKWRGTSEYFKVCPAGFFADFLAGVKKFFDDVNENAEKKKIFIERFNEAYPQK